MTARERSSVPLIICFGDSLTVGYQSPTPGHPERETPYGRFLQERLGPAARVAVSGVCGEVTGEMILRFRQDVLQHRPASVVVLGGTNDLGWNASPDAIMHNLLKMYEQALSAGIQPVAVTVPSLRLEGEPDGPQTAIRAADGFRLAPDRLEPYTARRQILNRLIADYCRHRDVRCVDLFTATLEPGTQRLAEPYSNDGLHLTTQGYQLLAALLYQQVFAGRFPHSGPVDR